MFLPNKKMIWLFTAYTDLFDIYDLSAVKLTNFEQIGLVDLHLCSLMRFNEKIAIFMKTNV